MLSPTSTLGSMDHFALMCDRVASHGSRLKKVRIVADYLATLDDADYERAVRFLAVGPVPAQDGKRMSIGYAALREAALLVTGWDEDTFRFCHQTVGDSGETISLLLHAFSQGTPLSLEVGEHIFQQLFRHRNTAARVELLADTFRRYRSDTMKFFIKTITGSFRIGLQEKQVEEAIALSLGIPAEEVRAANDRMGDLPTVALAARRNELHTIEVRLFHPMEFMLAKPLEKLDDLGDPAPWIIEDKFDGIRSQIHVDHGEVRIYTRGLEDVTHSYPEIVTAAKFLGGSAVLDGELLAWREQRALAFTVLQQRLARKKLSAELIEEIPVVFMAYDLLYNGGQLLVDRPFSERRSMLEERLHQVRAPFLLSQQHHATTLEEVDALFLAARDRGNEGLMLKRADSPYEAGRRSGLWMKLKRPYATLDVVITAAEPGSGKRATVLSDYTFAVKAGDRYLNVGKAYSGLTDVEIKEITRILKTAVLERYSRVHLVRPEVVLEVAFDGIQKSPRHKSGFALRFPRIVNWRKDKEPEEVDTLETVQALYEESLKTHG